MTQLNGKMDFSEFETEHSENLKNKKVSYEDYKNLSYRKRFFRFIGSLLSTLLTNFATKIQWQLGLVIYLFIVVPTGTYIAIKFIINLFF